MKNRRLTIVAFLLCATLVVGFGYAALTDILDITGSADVSAVAAQESFDEEVYFSDVVVIRDDGNTASRNADNVDKASFTAKNLKGQGDTAQFTFTIVNDSDLDANVTPAISSNTNEAFFAISSDWAGQTKLIPAGESKTYTVTVELLNTPTDTIGGSFIIELTAVSVDPVTP